MEYNHSADQRLSYLSRPALPCAIFLCARCHPCCRIIAAPSCSSEAIGTFMGAGALDGTTHVRTVKFARI
jgi:hypothetical protein